MLDLTIRRPSLRLLALEGRAPMEYASMLISRRMLAQLPKGDGRVVLVLPGLGAGDTLTAPLRATLKQLNYRAKPWRCGVNRGWNDRVRHTLLPEIDRLYEQSGRKITLLGWSLGGVFARELARRHSDKIHSVITLGSPISGNPKATTLHPLHQFVTGKPYTQKTIDDYVKRMAPPPVKSVAIYSKSDGIVAWRCSQELEHPHTQNVEVKSSHIGLVFNPSAIKAIAKALHE